jgi:hypothetical protein
MHRIIEKQIELACKQKGLSEAASNAIKKILSRKMNGQINSSEMSNDIARIFELVKPKNES